MLFSYIRLYKNYTILDYIVYSILLSYNILYYVGSNISYSIILYFNILYYVVLNYILFYSILLDLCCIILCYLMLYLIK